MADEWSFRRALMVLLDNAVKYRPAPVDLDKRTESFGFATDDGDHERQPEHAGADKGSGCAVAADQYGLRILQRTLVTECLRNLSIIRRVKTNSSLGIQMGVLTPKF
jgi:hypothetical protein